MKVSKTSPSLMVLAMLALSTHGFGQTTLSDRSASDPIACWDFSDQIAGTSLADGTRLPDSCNDHDGQVLLELEVISGAIPASAALRFDNTTANAFSFAPGFDFGDGGPIAGVEFDFAEGDSFTLEAIVRIPASFTGVGSLIAKDVGSGQPSWWFRISNGQLQGLISDGNEQSLTGSQTINDGQWRHIAMVHDADSNSLRLYVNYQQDASITVDPVGDIDTPPGTPIALGAFNDGNRQLQGDIQLARISGAALAPAEFQWFDTAVDLAVSIDHGGQALIPGGTASFDISFSNTGPADAGAVDVELLLPDWIASASWTCTANAGASCSAAGSGDLIDPVSLPAGSSVVYTLSANLAENPPASPALTASIDPGLLFDLDPSNNQATRFVQFSSSSALPCWNFGNFTPGTTLSNSERIADSCADRDARVIGEVPVIEGPIPGTSAIALSSASANAVRFEPGFDFGDGGDIAGPEFDFASDESFTIEAIIRVPESFTGIGSIVAKDVGFSQPSWWFRVQEGQLRGLISDGNLEQGISGSRGINNGLWHHVAMVRDADTDTLRMYVNYRQDAAITTQPITAINTPEGTPISLGAFNDENPNRLLHGDMHLAAISASALSPNEFQLFDQTVDLVALIDYDNQPLDPGDTFSVEISFSNIGQMDAAGKAVALELPDWVDSATWTCTASATAACSPSGSGDLIDLVDLPAGQNVVYTLTATVADSMPSQGTLTASIDPGEMFDVNPANNQAQRLFYAAIPALACWDFSDLPAGTSLSDGSRVEDSCQNLDARVNGQLAVVAGATPGGSALAFSATTSDALVFEPGYDFGDGGPVAGNEFDFASGDSFTLEAIIQVPEDFTGIGAIIAKDVDATQPSWWFRVQDGRLRGLISDGTEYVVQGNTRINTGSWHHVAMMLDADTDTLNLYVDYRLDASLDIGTIGDIATPPDTPISLGTFNNGTQLLEGAIQAARVTRAALPSSLFLLNDQIASVSVSISHNGQHPAGGDTTRYEITVTNAGPMNTRGISLEALMPAEFVSTIWTCEPGTGATCTPGGTNEIVDIINLPAGQSVVYTVFAQLQETLPRLFTYTASIEPGTFLDLNLADNESSLSIGYRRLYVNSQASGGDGSSWANAFQYLQHALAAAETRLPLVRSEIWVAGGVHFPHLGGPDPIRRQNAFTLVDYVEIFGGFAGTEESLEQRDWQSNPTVLSGDVFNNDTVNEFGVTEHWEDIGSGNAYHVVRGRDLPHALLDGLIISGGQADSLIALAGDYAHNGAGINLRHSNLTLRRVRLQGNFAFSEPAFDPSRGGAIYHFSHVFHALTLEDVVIKNNFAERGGGIGTFGGSVVGQQVTLSANQAIRFGGGFYMRHGAYQFQNSVFSGNSAERGGGLHSYTPRAALASTLITGNLASDNGGGIYHWEQLNPGALVLTNVTISGNHAGNRGGAVYRQSEYATGGRDTELSNSIIWNNSDGTGVGTITASHSGNANGSVRLAASHSLVQGWDFADESNFSGTDPDNAPEFLSPIDPADAPTVNGNFRLPDMNPFIDLGDNAARINNSPNEPGSVPPIPIAGNILNDLDGNPRVVDGNGNGAATIDLGPYESFGESGFTVGGLVSGLEGTGLVLQVNGGSDLAITENGSFTFPPLLDGSSYEVAVLTQPTGLSQTCSVMNGSGVIDGADVTDIEVTCTTNVFLIGGTVSGLTGSGLVLQNNGNNDLSITENGSFAFPAQPDGSSYQVTILSQPTQPEQVCTLANASGSLDGADINNIEVTCTSNSFTVGGTVSGLAGSGLVLQNNGGDDISIADNGSFSFPTPQEDQTDYAVTVLSQPQNPPQLCAVSNGSGTVDGEDISDIEVSCQAQADLIFGDRFQGTELESN